MNKKFFRRLQEEVLVYDGAVGTLLQASGLEPGECPEAWNLSHAATMQEIYGSYVDAGSDLILTFTFCGNRLKLDEFGLEDQTYAINRRAAELARAAVGRSGCLVAGDIGPTGQFVQPVGRLSFGAMYEIFREQVVALRDGGADVINIETMADLGEMRAALLAAKENTDLPILCQMTFSDHERTFLGTDPQTAVVVMQAMGADVVGANCSGGPRELLPVMAAMAQVSTLPLVVKPNAGLPQLIDGKTVFPATPAMMAEAAEEFARLGVNIIGGCCGSTPDHIRAISAVLKGRRPVLRAVGPRPSLASRTQAVYVLPGGKPLLIGERINPTGRRELAGDIRSGAMALVRQEAREQVAAGARVLDINVGAVRVDELTALPAAIEAVTAVVPCPLALDTSDPAALEAGLQAYCGKALINSVTGEAAKLAAVLPLAKKYGAAVIGLTLDEQGIPPTAEGRLAIARRIVEAARGYGIRAEDIWIDCLVLTAGAEQGSARETLRALRLVKEELGVATVLGVSNISYGLPRRSTLNAVFLTAALSQGLDAALIDPGDPKIGEVLRAWAVLQNTDPGAREYIAAETGQPPVGATPAQAEPIDVQLAGAIMDGDKVNIGGWVEEALRQGWLPLAVMDEILVPALEKVGSRYEQGTFFLPQLMLSAEAMQEASRVLSSHLPAGSLHSKGKIVLATVKGDIHDIGKNILAVLLRNYGYQVTDLGKDVPVDVILAAARAETAAVVGLSALMTTTMVQMPLVIKALRQANLDCRVIVGGAVTTSDYAERIGADGYAKNAQLAVQTIARLVRSRDQMGLNIEEENKNE